MVCNISLNRLKPLKCNQKGFVYNVWKSAFSAISATLPVYSLAWYFLQYYVMQYAYHYQNTVLGVILSNRKISGCNRSIVVNYSILKMTQMWSKDHWIKYFPQKLLASYKLLLSWFNQYWLMINFKPWKFDEIKFTGHYFDTIFMCPSGRVSWF